MASVNPTPLPGGVLPRAATLTDALLAVAGAHSSRSGRAEAERALRRGLARLTGSLGAEAVRVDRYLVRQALLRPHRLGGPEPFQWSARTAARTIGLAAVRASIREPSGGPASACTEVVRRMAREGEGDGPRSLGRWLHGLPAAARAAVCAEAATWATHLSNAVAWDRLTDQCEVGGPDRWWDCPTAPRIGLRCRVELRVDLTGVAPAPDIAPAVPSSSVLVMANGHPLPSSGDELAVVALADALARPQGPHAVRVVGWWPQSGRALVATVDDTLLARGVVAACGAVEALARRRRWSGAA